MLIFKSEKKSQNLQKFINKNILFGKTHKTLKLGNKRYHQPLGSVQVLCQQVFHNFGPPAPPPCVSAISTD